MLRHCLRFVFGIAAGVAGVYYLKKLGDTEGQDRALTVGDTFSQGKDGDQSLIVEASHCTSN